MVSASPVADFEGAYRAERGRRPHPATLEAVRDLLHWLGRCYLREGEAIRRTVPQIVRGLGWEDMGPVQANRDRYKNRIYRRLAMLQDIGWVDHYGELPPGPDGVGVGILVVLSPAGVAQSVLGRPADTRSSQTSSPSPAAAT